MASDDKHTLVFDHPDPHIRRTHESSQWVIADHVPDECPVCGAAVVDCGYHHVFGGVDTIEHTTACDYGHRITAYTDALHNDEDDEEEVAERVGKVFVDEQNGDRVVVTKVCDEKADEYVVTYDYEQAPVTVDDFDGNEPYPSDDTVVEAEYFDDREKFDDPKVYAFPISRLVDVDEYEADEDDDLMGGEPCTDEEPAEVTATADEEDGELVKSEFFERHYFQGRKSATVVPARMRDFHLVCHAHEPDEGVDLIYEGDDGLVRLTRTSPDGGDYMATHETTDGTEELGTWSSSSKAIDAIARRMANVSGTMGDAA